MAGLVMVFGILFAIFVKPVLSKKSDDEQHKEIVENDELEASSTPV